MTWFWATLEFFDFLEPYFHVLNLGKIDYKKWAKFKSYIFCALVIFFPGTLKEYCRSVYLNIFPLCCKVNTMVILHKHWLHLLDQGVWKLQKKVSFNIASEASYIYILSVKRLLKLPKMVCEKLKLAIKQCLKTQMRHFG